MWGRQVGVEWENDLKSDGRKKQALQNAGEGGCTRKNAEKRRESGGRKEERVLPCEMPTAAANGNAAGNSGSSCMSDTSPAERRVQLIARALISPDHYPSQKMHLCKFDELPAIEGQPAGCAWNYYAEDKSKRDQLGRRCLVTAYV